MFVASFEKKKSNCGFSWLLWSKLSLCNVLLRYFCPSQSHENTNFFSGNFMVYPFLFRLIIHQLILYYENYLIFTSSNIFGYAIYSHQNANLLPPKLTYEAVRNGCSPKRTSVTIQTDQLDLSPSDPFATTLAK